MKRPLWEIRSISEVVASLVNWGHGSGEELYNYLTTRGLSTSDAQTICALLAKVTD